MQNQRHPSGNKMTKSKKCIEEFNVILERFGVAEDIDWLAAILFVRNLVTHLTIFDNKLKRKIQHTILDELSQKDLTEEAFTCLIGQLESFLIQNKTTLELQQTIDLEKRSTVALVDEMNSLFLVLRSSNKRQELSINRFDQQTMKTVESAPDKLTIVKQVRALLTELVTEFKEEAHLLKDHIKSLERTANYDPLLTDLYNRRSFDSYLDDTTIKSQSRTTPLSLMIVDVDHFNTINNKHGYQTGDDLLRALAKIIYSNATRIDGYPARYRGDKLTMICALNANKAIYEAESIREDVEGYEFKARKNGKFFGKSIQFTVSIGVAQLENSWTADHLVDAAKKALNKAKLSGRNIVSHHPFTSNTLKQ